MGIDTSVSHSAEGAALGFYYQSLYALYEILDQPHDDASVCLERLDDLEVLANGQPLLVQLKHSIARRPASVTLASRPLWKTLKAWIDILPKVELTETRFQLVTVAPLEKESTLAVFLDEKTDRADLHDELVEEAQRVVNEHQAAIKAAKTPLPHAERIGDCTAFLQLDKSTRTALLARMTVRPGSSNIKTISSDIANRLVNFPPDQRAAICTRLIEWWDLQVVFTLCGKRERSISKIEVLQKISEISGEIERDELLPDFELAPRPDADSPDPMIIRQIELVRGSRSDVRLALREEWRARAQRHKWSTERLDMATRIGLYDQILLEKWQDKFDFMIEDCDGLDESTKQKQGQELLRWSYNLAHREVRPFAPNWSASYYVSGSYQVLSIALKVGWHPQFKELLTPAL